MFLLQNPTLVSALGNLNRHGQSGILSPRGLRNIAGSLRQSRSVGDLINPVQNPFGTSAAKDNKSGCGDQAKHDVERQRLEQRRQVLRLQLQEVRDLGRLSNVLRLTFVLGSIFR